MSTIDYKHHNPWIHHVRLFAEAHKLSYGCALSNPKIKEGYEKGRYTPKIERKKKEKKSEDDRSVSKAAKKRKEPEAVEKYFSKEEIAGMEKRQKERAESSYGGLTKKYLNKAEFKLKEKELSKKFKKFSSKSRK
jgi:hypothetical protein